MTAPARFSKFSKHSLSVKELLLVGVFIFELHKWPITKTNKALEEIHSLGANSSVTNEKVLISLEFPGSLLLHSHRFRNQPYCHQCESCP
jgi:hypothetical protein